jgi:hypothetical protein
MDGQVKTGHQAVVRNGDATSVATVVEREGILNSFSQWGGEVLHSPGRVRVAARCAKSPGPDDQRYTGSMSIVFNWNGDDLPDEVRRQMPEELQGLPRGRYVLESVDDAPELTDEDEAGIQTAIDSLRAGRGVPLDAAKGRIDRILKK